MPELLDELSIARSGGTLKKVLESYKKKDLLILDEWLIRPLSPQESYDMLEIVEARCHKSTIFCTQYESEVGTPGSIPTRNLTAPFQKPLWTALSTTLMRFWWMAESRCGNARA